jgi:hypothetical protein
MPTGTPTCSARGRHGRWALYPNGDQVVVEWPGGSLNGPPGEVARELDRLDRLGDGRDGLDDAAALAIRRFLTDPGAQDGASAPVAPATLPDPSPRPAPARAA